MARNTAYTDGPIGSVMLKTALSMLPGTLAISGYNIVDTYFVSDNNIFSGFAFW